MFTALDQREKKIVIDAMDERRYSRGEAVITQGNSGDDLFVVDSGYLECFIKASGQQEKIVKSYSQGDSFGELALLYNAPRYVYRLNAGQPRFELRLTRFFGVWIERRLIISSKRLP